MCCAVYLGHTDDIEVSVNCMYLISYLYHIYV